MAMSADQQTYKRAANAALVGLITQLVLAGVAALLGLYAQAPAIHAVTWHLFGGVPIWLLLWLLYHQHQLERLEALEAEQLARTDEQAARLFDEAGQQLALARRRLNGLYKWGLHGVSVLVAVYLAAVGGALLWRNYGQHQADRLIEAAVSADANALILAMLSTLLAFVSFIVGRYVSGMTRLRQWQLLRGGAGYLMGSAMLAALLVVASIMRFFGQPVGFAVLALVVPAFMVLVGGETALAFVLEIYRPRRRGEVMRPAFDSRVLGWLTSPESIGRIISETLNYQFGFEISRSWFYRLLARAITPLMVVAALVLVLLSSLVIVPPHQEAVLTRFGAAGEPVGPGLHIKWPWPIGGAERYSTSRVHSVTVGSSRARPGEADIWRAPPMQGGPSDVDYMVSPPPRTGSQLRVPVAAGELVGGRLEVRYTIKNLKDFVTHAPAEGRQHELVRALAQRVMTRFFASHSLEQLLMQREDGHQQLREALQDSVDRHRLGLHVSYARVSRVTPPAEEQVVQAFHDRIAAMQDKQARVQEAEREAVGMLASVAGSRDQAMEINQAREQLIDLRQAEEALQQQLRQHWQRRLRPTGVLVPEWADQQERQLLAQLEATSENVTEQELHIEQLIEQAGGEAAQTLAQARASRWQTPLKAQGEAERFSAQLGAYQQAPRYYKQRRYLQVLSEAMQAPRKIITTTGTDIPPTVRLQLETAGNPVEGLLGNGQQ
jgi:regulator of protease activity HflC (stomatin/prohibitin superfamily)